MSTPNVTYQQARRGLDIERDRVAAWEKVSKAVKAVLPYRLTVVRPSDVEEALGLLKMWHAEHGLLAVELQIALEDYYSLLDEMENDRRDEMDQEAEMEYEQERFERSLLQVSEG